ncbi:DNA ligase [Luteimonas sp. BDR2-5]|uniref:DNA ligase n=1 Tax=Proluteimonas luteida TaxID=2878685 RepID=UPI001E33EFA2|nr:DNA ligase [Luteimonas sp. BDR2-5]MCD9030065.1 DNA ligase [Luteimonas sp. BDR2-5]
MPTRAVLIVLLLAALGWLAPMSATAAGPPPLMLATAHRDGIDVAAYLVSEKYDGVRGRWDGRALWTRGGHRIDVPADFVRGWPDTPLDGELWIARGRFDAVSALSRARRADDPLWEQVRFLVFDLPAHAGPFAARVDAMRALVDAAGNPRLQAVPQRTFADRAALDAHLHAVLAAGGEGLMLHHRDAYYRVGRSDTLLKYKPHEDAEARVVAHAPGRGKYTGMLGALEVEHADGRRFRIGSGFSDAQRAAPPPVGSWVTYRYNGLTSTGLPRFVRFLRVRHEPAPAE